MRIFSCFLLTLLFLACTKDSNDNNINSGTQVGSYSTMITVKQKLYIVNKTTIYTYDVTNARNPVEVNKQDVGFDIESLYHHDGLLLIGSANNMYIFRLSDKGIPTKESTTTYVQAFENVVCQHDPIVARSNLAYITLSAQTNPNARCTRITNELRVYDITDINKAKLLNTLQMAGPKGLGIGKNKLFVCDSNAGLLIFDISDPVKPVKSKIFEGYSAYDVIVRNNLLIVVGKDRLMQYDISDENNIKFIGKIDF